MKIVFKNNREVEITQEVAEIITKGLLKPRGAANWQTFSDEKTGVFLIVNLTEVAYIN